MKAFGQSDKVFHCLLIKWLITENIEELLGMSILWWFWDDFFQFCLKAYVVGTN